MKIKLKILFVFFTAIFTANIARSMSVDEMVKLAWQKPVNVDFVSYIDELYMRALKSNDIKVAEVLGMSYEQVLSERRRFIKFFRSLKIVPEGSKYVCRGEYAPADQIYDFALSKGFGNMRVFRDCSGFTHDSATVSGAVVVNFEYFNRISGKECSFVLSHELSHERYGCFVFLNFLRFLFQSVDPVNFVNSYICRELPDHEVPNLFCCRASLMAKLYTDIFCEFSNISERFADARACAESADNCLGLIENQTFFEQSRHPVYQVSLAHDLPGVRKEMARAFLQIHLRDRIAKGEIVPVQVVPTAFMPRGGQW